MLHARPSRRTATRGANPAESYAGRFAGKEAVGKALGFGVARAFAWTDIEIVGRPEADGPALGPCRRLGASGAA